MAIQYDNPYYVGLTGLLGIPSAYNAMHEVPVKGSMDRRVPESINATLENLSDMVNEIFYCPSSG